jgi:hypothetical protein
VHELQSKTTSTRAQSQRRDDARPVRVLLAGVTSPAVFVAPVERITLPEGKGPAGLSIGRVPGAPRPTNRVFLHSDLVQLGTSFGRRSRQRLFSPLRALPFVERPGGRQRRSAAELVLTESESGPGRELGGSVSQETFRRSRELSGKAVGRSEVGRRWAISRRTTRSRSDPRGLWRSERGTLPHGLDSGVIRLSTLFSHNSPT